MSKKKMRLGRVQISMSYVVNLNDADMVQEAKDCLYEDLMNAYKYDEIGANIEVIKTNDKASDIPEFLLGSVDEVR